MPTGFYPRKSLKDRFFKRVLKTSYCWIWGGAIGTHGYGKIGLNNKTMDTHRASWIVHFGELAEGQWVLHKCDNRKCVNPEHLFLGNRVDNVRDCVSKRRHIFGEKSKNSKMTFQQIKEIRNLEKMGFSQREIGKKFGVHQTTVHYILSKKTWLLEAI